MKKIVYLILVIAVMINPILPLVETTSGLDYPLRRVRVLPQETWDIDTKLVNGLLEGLGFVSPLAAGSLITTGTQLVLDGGYLLKFEVIGDDKYATVFDRNAMPIASLKIMRDGKPVLTMYHGDFQRVVSFLGASNEVRIEENDAEGTWSLVWKEKPEVRDRTTLLLHSPSGEKITTETFPEGSYVTTVILENNVVIRQRQLETEGDIVDLDSISLHQSPDGRFYTLLAFWNEETNTPHVVIYQGRVVFDRVRKSEAPEKLLDNIIYMAKQGVIPEEATLISEWEDHSYRGVWVHRFATLAAMATTFVTIQAFMGLDPTSLLSIIKSAAIAGVTAFLLYKCNKTAWMLGIKQQIAYFMNIDRIKNFYPESRQFFANGIQRSGGWMFHTTIKSFNPGNIAEHTENTYKELRDNPGIVGVANDRFYVTTGSCTEDYALRLQEIYSSWVLSLMFPDYKFVVLFEELLEMRNLLWKPGEQQRFAGVVTEGVLVMPKSIYTDKAIFGAYAVPEGTPIYQGDPLIAALLTGNVTDSIFEQRLTELGQKKAYYETRLRQIESEMGKWSGIPSIINFDPNFRKLQEEQRILQEQIKIVSGMIRGVERFRSQISGGARTRTPAFGWITEMKDSSVKGTFLEFVKRREWPADLSLMDLCRLMPILTPSEAQIFIETGILVFKNGRVIDPYTLPGLRDKKAEGH